MWLRFRSQSRVRVPSLLGELDSMCLWPTNQNIKQRQCCNKFSKDFKTMVHIKKKKKSLQTSPSVLVQEADISKCPSAGEMSLPPSPEPLCWRFPVSVPFLPPHANWDMSWDPLQTGKLFERRDLYCHRFSESYCLHVMSQGLLVLRGLSYLHLTWSYCVCRLWDVQELSKTQSSLPNWNRGFNQWLPSQIWPRSCFPYLVKYLFKNWIGWALKMGTFLSKMKYQM